MKQRPMPLLAVVTHLLLRVAVLQYLFTCSTAQQQQLQCLTADGSLQEGQFIQQGVCLSADEAIWYYDLVGAPIASNGLEAGAPTHFHILFGSLGNPVEDAFDYENYGLYIPGNQGNLTIELSPQFLYNQQDPQLAQGLWTTELALAPANILFSSPCLIDEDTERGQVVCAGWVSELGADNLNEIVVLAPDGLFGERALQVGVKFFHLHPVIELGRPIYYNANGTCLYPNTTENEEEGIATSSTRNGDSDSTYYCRFPSDCPGYIENSTETAIICVPALEPLTGSVTATLYGENGSIIHKGTRSYQFDPEPHYHVSETNTRIACNVELHETVNFQRVPPNTNVMEVELKVVFENGECDHSASAPYAPRFFIFAPNYERTAFPQFPVTNLTATLDNDNAISGQLFSGEELIGSFELIQPTQDAGGRILEDNLGFVGDGPGRIGGTIVAIPIRTGSELGKYTVQVTLIGGTTARSTIIVEDTAEDLDSGSASWFHGIKLWFWHCSFVCLALLVYFG